MKKLLLTALVAFAITQGYAQVQGDNQPLADGSIAPDFTAVDINGETHSLYADYLNQGKSVVIDFSATWCGPCWSYHQTHAMADLYEAYGPAGSNELMVIFVEGDIANTTLENIYGEQGPIAMSQGNWTIGSPYPIIEDTEELELGAASNYDVDYFPTMYMICAETKQTTSVDQFNATQLRNVITNGCQTLTGIPNHGRIDAPTEIRLCQAGVATNVVGKLKNFGNNAITAATIVLKKNGEIIQTKNYTSTNGLNQFATAATITFNDVVLEPGASYTVNLVDINGVAITNPELNTANVVYSIANQAESNEIEVRIHTDNYPSEASWQIKNSSGTIVAQGGDYEAGDDDQWGGGGPDANTTKIHNVTLPATEFADCHTVVLKDSYGDGWSLGTTPHGVEIYSNGVLVYEKWIGNFGSTSNNTKAFLSEGELAGSESFTQDAFAIYPNPTSGILNIKSAEAVTISIVDLTGKVVYTAADVNNGDTINLSSLQKGMYIAQINGATTQKTEKIILE